MEGQGRKGKSEAKESLMKAWLFYFFSAGRKELYERDWRNAELYAVAASLDPDTAHPKLIISESRRHVSSIGNVPQNCDAPTHHGPGEYGTVLSFLVCVCPSN
ncbi:erythroid membrane-associated protein-like isoform X2 [Lemur catta]|uniref:erythroid membrane-associated protein-like isoform X2 n=1 Tax=Lemur catta TaxID=9447 RepID=UPI001E26BB79|nr:erythroid membrane-associated protein-like isoform X2 [Lemur catta]